MNVEGGLGENFTTLVPSSVPIVQQLSSVIEGIAGGVPTLYVDKPVVVTDRSMIGREPDSTTTVLPRTWSVFEVAQDPGELLPGTVSSQSTPLYLPSGPSKMPLLLKSMNGSLASRMPFSLKSTNASPMSVDLPFESMSSLVGLKSNQPLPFKSVKPSSPTAYAKTVTLPLVGRMAWLVNDTVQVPFTDTQELAMEPPSAVNVNAVPSGTGLRKWSDMRTVSCVVTPSYSQPSMLIVEREIENPSCAGIPVVTVSWSDCVVRVCVPVEVDAVTRTGVLTVPDCTLVITSPVAGSDVAVVELSEIPPTVVFRLNVTVRPPSGLPPISTTRKETCEVSCRPKPPVPRNEIDVGVDATY